MASPHASRRRRDEYALASKPKLAAAVARPFASLRRATGEMLDQITGGVVESDEQWDKKNARYTNTPGLMPAPSPTSPLSPGKRPGGRRNASSAGTNTTALLTGGRAREARERELAALQNGEGAVWAYQQQEARCRTCNLTFHSRERLAEHHRLFPQHAQNRRAATGSDDYFSQKTSRANGTGTSSSNASTPGMAAAASSVPVRPRGHVRSETLPALSSTNGHGQGSGFGYGYDQGQSYGQMGNGGAERTAADYYTSGPSMNGAVVNEPQLISLDSSHEGHEHEEREELLYASQPQYGAATAVGNGAYGRYIGSYQHPPPHARSQSLGAPAMDLLSGPDFDEVYGGAGSAAGQAYGYGHGPRAASDGLQPALRPDAVHAHGRGASEPGLSTSSSSRVPPPPIPPRAPSRPSSRASSVRGLDDAPAGAGAAAARVQVDGADYPRRPSGAGGHARAPSSGSIGGSGEISSVGAGVPLGRNRSRAGSVESIRSAASGMGVGTASAHAQGLKRSGSISSIGAGVPRAPAGANMGREDSFTSARSDLSSAAGRIGAAALGAAPHANLSSSAGAGMGGTEAASPQPLRRRGSGSSIASIGASVRAAFMSTASMSNPTASASAAAGTSSSSNRKAPPPVPRKDKPAPAAVVRRPVPPLDPAGPASMDPGVVQAHLARQLEAERAQRLAQQEQMQLQQQLQQQQATAQREREEGIASPSRLGRFFPTGALQRSASRSSSVSSMRNGMPGGVRSHGSAVASPNAQQHGGATAWDSFEHEARQPLTGPGGTPDLVAASRSSSDLDVLDSSLQRDALSPRGRAGEEASEFLSDPPAGSRTFTNATSPFEIDASPGLLVSDELQTWTKFQELGPLSSTSDLSHTLSSNGAHGDRLRSGRATSPSRLRPFLSMRRSLSGGGGGSNEDIFADNSGRRAAPPAPIRA